MRWLAIGGDRRMQGATEAAGRAGWESAWIPDGHLTGEEQADVVQLPWPHSFRDGRLIVSPPHEGAQKEALLAGLPPCRLVLHGSGVTAPELPQAGCAINPADDELFLRFNAQLTAEGAICRAMQRMERALLGSTCLITGYGRIGQALCTRLCAMGAFVVVCARSEMQMRAAHAVGAHPVPLQQLEEAASAADLIVNTVPARVLGPQALTRVKPQAVLLELASAPYGVDPDAARALNLAFSVESGVPGRYAPLEAGAALFEAAQRCLKRMQEGEKDG